MERKNTIAISRTSLIMAVVAAALLCGSVAWAARVYRYIDDNGQEHYINRPKDAPERYRDTVEEVYGVKVYDKNGKLVSSDRFVLNEEDSWRMLIRPTEWGFVKKRADRPFWLTLIELWKSRLVFSLPVLFWIVTLLVAGIFWWRDLDLRQDKIKFGILHALAGLAAAALLAWLVIVPQTARFGAGLAEKASLSANRAVPGSERKETLVKLNKAGSFLAEKLTRD